MYARWRNTLLSHRGFVCRLMASGKPISARFGFPGFDMKYCTIDLMHVADLGINVYHRGCILFELFVRMGGLITNPGQTLGELTTLMKAASKAVGQDRPPLIRITWGMIRSKGASYPKLRAKASESRHLVPVVLHMLRHYFPPRIMKSLFWMPQPNSMPFTKDS